MGGGHLGSVPRPRDHEADTDANAYLASPDLRHANDLRGKLDRHADKQDYLGEVYSVLAAHGRWDGLRQQIGTDPVLETAEQAGALRLANNPVTRFTLPRLDDMHGGERDKLSRDADLAAQLGDLGSTLSVQEQQQYVAQYRASRAYQKAEAKANAEGSQLTADLAKLDVLENVDNYRDDLIRGHMHQATFDSGCMPAMQWVDANRNTPEWQAHQTELDNIQHAAEDTLQRWTKNQIAPMFARRDLSAAQKLEAAIQLIDTQVIDRYQGFAALAKLVTLKAKLEAFRVAWAASGGHALDALNALSTVQPSEVSRLGARLASYVGGVAEMFDNTATLLDNRSVVAAAGALKGVYEAASELRDANKAGDESAARRALAVLRVNASAAKLVLGPIGLAVAVAALDDTIEQTNAEGLDPALAGQLVGNTLCTVGAALDCIPALAPLGEALSIVGTAISTVAGLFRPSEHDRRAGEERAIVSAIKPGDTQFADTFANTSSARNIDVFEGYLDGDHIVVLGRRLPFLFTTDAKPVAQRAVQAYEWARAHGLQGKYASSLFEFLMSAHPDKLEALVAKLVPRVQGQYASAVHACFPEDAFA